MAQTSLRRQLLTESERGASKVQPTSGSRYATREDVGLFRKTG